jgi:hypothetical protein
VRRGGRRSVCCRRRCGCRSRCSAAAAAAAAILRLLCLAARGSGLGEHLALHVAHRHVLGLGDLQQIGAVEELVVHVGDALRQAPPRVAAAAAGVGEVGADELLEELRVVLVGSRGRREVRPAGAQPGGVWAHAEVGEDRLHRCGSLQGGSTR